MNDGNQKLDELPTDPGSVLGCDGFLFRTRWDNWVTEDGSILTDGDIQDDLDAGHLFTIVYDASRGSERP